jgi:hypothetical protein
MAKFKLEIKMDNAAFGDSPELELSRILSELSLDVAEDQREEYNIRDENGNTVGKAIWS